jgi:hypothetical protein
MSAIFPTYTALAAAQAGTVAVFLVDGVEAQYPVFVWATRKATLPADETGPEIEYTDVVGLVQADDSSAALVAVDDELYQGEFVEYRVLK